MMQAMPSSGWNRRLKLDDPDVLLSRTELNEVIEITERNLDRLLEAWNDHKRKTE